MALSLALTLTLSIVHSYPNLNPNRCVQVALSPGRLAGGRHGVRLPPTLDRHLDESKPKGEGGVGGGGGGGGGGSSLRGSGGGYGAQGRKEGMSAFQSTKEVDASESELPMDLDVDLCAVIFGSISVLMQYYLITRLVLIQN